ncbi:hypothetical protein B0H19DRAFT_955872, partial [Mycena capillaripes]
VHNIIMAQMLKRNKWVLKTKWAGFRVYNKEKSLGFIMAKYLIHWAHIISVFSVKMPSLMFLNDLIDGDMFSD